MMRPSNIYHIYLKHFHFLAFQALFPYPLRILLTIKLAIVLSKYLIQPLSGQI
ncbi:hypothetical protein SAMN05421733_102245 [Acinetobacter boissieri]|uniref:Uncharacterized protein n=1 Tax=Acinetobacter boissieri TaxID=1219383 RepID=A0A1G6GUP7_9GAMM|nr:hypothetical protein SAMN05421733_102245 [Acinetobacter boissieri]